MNDKAIEIARFKLLVVIGKRIGMSEKEMLDILSKRGGEACEIMGKMANLVPEDKPEEKKKEEVGKSGTRGLDLDGLIKVLTELNNKGILK